MKQKAQDFLMLIQQDRRAKFFAILAVLAILFVMFGPGNTPPPSGPAPLTQQEEPLGSPGLGNTEAYEDIIRRFDGELNDLLVSVAALGHAQDEQRERFEEYDAKTAAIFTKVLERLNQVSQDAGQGPDAYPANIDIEGEELSETQDDVQIFGEIEQEAPVPPPVPEEARQAFIGVGDSVRVKLIAGVNAPTDGTPYPVLFQIVSDIVGPDGSRLPVGEARVVAAAQGSISDSRALYRLTDLSLRLPNGERKVVKIDGWVVGEDGIRGMPGILKDQLGRVIAVSAGLGAIDGFGRAIVADQVSVSTFGNGSQETVISGEVETLAAGGALRGASDALTEVIRERFEQLTPVVQIYSGREATAVFASSVVVDGLYEALEDVDYQYASLDSWFIGV